ncbi:archaeal DNA-binding protein [Caldisphaera lagunensis DSM 15908]|uniref:Archaeal DNA-binding protein n=1 Tax=Caldisphaera lagunensis (strain DSM 15908 / JCM 11604 / ANMR 0165 / IC-154) TaxID=1056495 RepID=L0A9L6_CALLD|nr:DNA-binding protein [Caldisphaera lagunensis]AFZ70566.1 archaeal DNA-binding protein [Caldisphaera lagunensis DSM 15908]
MEERVKINLGKEAIEDYALQAILELNKGTKQVEITGVGENVCKVAEVYLAMKSRLGDSLKIVSSLIGTSKTKGKKSSYLTIVIEKTA